MKVAVLERYSIIERVSVFVKLKEVEEDSG